MMYNMQLCFSHNFLLIPNIFVELFMIVSMKQNLSIHKFLTVEQKYEKNMN